jgi:flagellin-like hook-associated protein FlgL
LICVTEDAVTRINADISSLRATHRLLAYQPDLTTRLRRGSTGLRINTGGDEPVGLAAPESLRSELAGIHQAIESSNRAVNVLATADSALGDIARLLVDLSGVIDKSANDGTPSEDGIRANQLQVDSILDGIDRISSTAQFAGEKLLDGNLDFILSGADGGGARAHAGISAISTATLGDPTLGTLRSIGSGQAYSMDKGKYAEAETVVRAALLQVRQASGRLSSVREEQLEPRIRSQQVTYENIRAGESAIQDTEYASEVATMTRAQILVQSKVSSLRIANQLPQDVLALLSR